MYDLTIPESKQKTIGGRLFDIFDEGADHPWDFIKEWDGTSDWHRKFMFFVNLGPARSVADAYESFRQARFETTGKLYKTDKPNDAWWRKRKNAYWSERAEAYDYWRYEVERIATTREAIGRKMEVDQRDWDTGVAMLESVERMREQVERVSRLIPLMAQGAEREVSDVMDKATGIRTVTIERIVQVNVTPAQIVNMFGRLTEIQDKLSARQRRSLGLPEKVESVQSHVEVSGDVGVNATYEEHLMGMRQRQAQLKITELEAEVTRLRVLLAENGIVDYAVEVDEDAGDTGAIVPFRGISD